MRVVHLETGRRVYGGALQVLLLVDGLEKRGLENILVVPKGSAVEAEARRRNLPVRALPVLGDADLAFPFRFHRLLREIQPSLVHLHSRRGADTLGALTTKLARVPAVLSRRVDNPEPGWSLGAKYRLFDAVITISDVIGKGLVERGVPVGKVFTVRSALDPAPYAGPCRMEAFRREFGLSEGDRAVGMAAQFIPRKGHETLLEAVPRILRAHPRTRFLLFGQGSTRPGISARIRASGLDGTVLLPGFRDDLPNLLPCLDVLVHPATMEGLGIILLQAGAAGIPVVASAAGGIPEVIGHERNGILFPPNDASGLAGAVCRLLSDPNLARALGQEGRRRVREAFSVDRMVEGNLAVYRKVLAS
jgi:glycosyltransferase involved in cell wall biosynthesis